MILGESEQFPEIAETFYSKAIKRTESTLANWLKTQAERGLIEIDNADSAAGMLLGMLAFQPQRAVMFGHAPCPTGRNCERRAQASSQAVSERVARAAEPECGHVGAKR